jgi:high-affinity nickel-transport protein
VLFWSRLFRRTSFVAAFQLHLRHAGIETCIDRRQCDEQQSKACVSSHSLVQSLALSFSRAIPPETTISSYRYHRHAYCRESHRLGGCRYRPCKCQMAEHFTPAKTISQHWHTPLVSTAVLSYTLGLRHALDADHISAIDLMTRRLIAAGQRPVTVGMFFSLGHSTIVVITSLVVAGTAAAVSSKFDNFARVGGIVGTSVSAAFLLLLGLMNVYILYKLIVQMKRIIASEPGSEHDEFKIQGGGCLFPILQRLFKLVDRPWKMYPLGVLFGLGFDTSSEIAILGISSIQATKGTSIWLILIFPLLFTAGMCLLDTTDGALMMSLYTSTELARDPIAICYYSIVLTVITVIVAATIGTVQFLNLILNVAEPHGSFWDGVERLGEAWDIVGKC